MRESGFDFCFFFQAEDGIRDGRVTGVQTCALPISATASHELRTPLATQRALIEVSLSGSLTPEQLELLSRQLLATNERNEQLIDGLLTLAETDRGLVTTAPVPLDEVVPAAAEQFRAAAVAADVTLSVEAAPVTVMGE